MESRIFYKTDVDKCLKFHTVKIINEKRDIICEFKIDEEGNFEVYKGNYVKHFEE